MIGWPFGPIVAATPSRRRHPLRKVANACRNPETTLRYSISVNCTSSVRWIAEKLSSDTSVSTVSPSAVT